MFLKEPERKNDLYTFQQSFIAMLIGATALGVILSQNFRRLGHPQAATNSIILGIAIGLLEQLARFALVEQVSNIGYRTIITTVIFTSVNMTLFVIVLKYFGKSLFDESKVHSRSSYSKLLFTCFTSELCTTGLAMLLGIAVTKIFLEPDQR